MAMFQLRQPRINSGQLSSIDETLDRIGIARSTAPLLVEPVGASDERPIEI
jgi:hypothetical protein